MKSHMVQRAVILAAGNGTRMLPLTLETPKPLIRVNGVRMIDTVIQGLLANGIEEIHLVVGYKKEQFISLCRTYPRLDLIENPCYSSCNNISSLYFARDFLENCMILDGDQIIYNPSVLEATFSRSGYNAVWCTSGTKEWLMDVRDGVVRSCSRTGGLRGWQLFSISRWTAGDGAMLRKHLELEFVQRHNTQIYWDDVAMFCHPEDYTLGIREMNAGDVIEIDTLAELAEADPAYRKYLPEAQLSLNAQ